MIEPQLKNYQYLVNEVKREKVDYEQAINYAEKLQSTLIRFFRGSVLLFHPDKSNGNEDLRMMLTELFKKFQKLSESSLEKLKEGQQAMLACYSQSTELRNLYELVKKNGEKLAEWAEEIKLFAEEVRAANKVLEKRINDHQEKIDSMEEKINYIQENLDELFGFFSQFRTKPPAEDPEQDDLEEKPCFANYSSRP